MSDSFETEALRYLLNEMEGGARAEFEERLARDPAARSALKSCADAMARFACDQAPAEPMSATDERAALKAVMAAALPAERSAGRAVSGNVIYWTRFAWPIAAALLLGLNLIDFRRPIESGSRVPRMAHDKTTTGEIMADGMASGEPASEAAGKSSNEKSAVATAAPELVRGQPEIPRAKLAADLAQTSRELAKLRADYADLQRTSAALRAEYDTVVQHWAARMAFDRSVGRLAAMELVDADSYARGDRKGLVEVARGILTEPGLIVAATTPDMSGVEPTDTSVVDPGSAGQPVTPYAWAVFDDKEQRGYLNLYNLPRVAREESLQLWVRVMDAVQYQRVGEVPPTFYGGSGSLQYQMADGAVPAEILITREPRNTVLEQPAGPTVLRGP